MTDIELFNESGMDIPLSGSDFADMTRLVSEGENRTFSLLEIVYVNPSGILEVNSKFLKKKYVTDIITFPYSEENSDLISNELEGTIYMCNQRIREQAQDLETDIDEEFRRIFIHGLLHLCGYHDDSVEAKNIMTEKENTYLKAFNLE